MICNHRLILYTHPLCLTLEFPHHQRRRVHTYPNFWQTAGYYDIINRDGKTNVNELWISQGIHGSDGPTTGEDIEIIYSGEHDLLDDDTDVYTLLDRHLELIVLFVRWTAYQELATEESSNPDPTSLQSGTLELNAYRAKRDYRYKLAQWQAAEAESATAAWAMDQHDRVY